MITYSKINFKGSKNQNKTKLGVIVGVRVKRSLRCLKININMKKKKNSSTY